MWKKIISRPKLLAKLEILFLLPSIGLYIYWIYNIVSGWMYGANTDQGGTIYQQLVFYMIYFPVIIEKDFYIFLICEISTLITVILSTICLKFSKPKPRRIHIINLVLGSVLFAITGIILVIYLFLI